MELAMVIRVCKDCPNRVIGCHAECEEYRRECEEGRKKDKPEQIMNWYAHDLRINHEKRCKRSNPYWTRRISKK